MENRRRLVTKEELLAAIWPATFVEEAVLTVNVHALRKALGDDRNGQSFIQTVPRRGYRFVAEVQVQKPNAMQSRWGLHLATRVSWRTLSLISALAALTVAAVLLFWRIPQKPTLARGRAMLVVLPFENLSKDAADEYLSDGLTEEMITQLASLILRPWESLPGPQQCNTSTGRKGRQRLATNWGWTTY